MNHQTTRPQRPTSTALPPGWDVELCQRYLAKHGKSQAQLDYEQWSIKSKANIALLRALGSFHGKGRPTLPAEFLSKKQEAIRKRNSRAKMKRITNGTYQNQK